MEKNGLVEKKVRSGTPENTIQILLKGIYKKGFSQYYIQHILNYTGKL